MAQLNLNLNNYDAQEGFDVLPPGWYEAEVIDSEIKSGAKGKYINWTFGIVGKPNRVWDVMSLGNDVAMQRLKTLAVCCGHRNPNYIADTEELHGMSCQVRLKVEKDESGQYEPKNKITAFKPKNGHIPQMMNPQAQASAAPVNGDSAQKTDKPKMPWE